MKKTIELQHNAAGGIDLLVSRDAGNDVLVLTGKPTNSREFWMRLRDVCEDALDQLEGMESEVQEILDQIKNDILVNIKRYVGVEYLDSSSKDVCRAIIKSGILDGKDEDSLNTLFGIMKDKWLYQNITIDDLRDDTDPDFKAWRKEQGYKFDRYVDDNDYWYKDHNGGQMPCGTTAEIYDKYNQLKKYK